VSWVNTLVTGPPSVIGRFAPSPAATFLGGENPTGETPGYTIEFDAPSVHDGRMESLINLVVDSVLDPVVLVPAAAVCAALLSGLVARIAELWEERPPARSRRPADRQAHSQPTRRPAGLQASATR
jgi:hypothetical protein